MKLGSLSAKYESNGDPGAVSTGWGDAGGVSYGTYQLSSNTGGVRSFIGWVQGKEHSCVDILNQHQPGSREFSVAWKFCAENYADFGDLQHDYIEYAYYLPAVTALVRAGFHIENHHDVMKDVVWSRSVQYGIGYIVEMFEDACRLLGYPNLSYVDTPDFDKAMVKAVYLDVCKTEEWTNGSPALREGLYTRYENECNDALERLG